MIAPSGLLVQDAALERHRHRLRAIVHAELGDDAAHEPLGRPASDLQSSAEYVAEYLVEPEHIKEGAEV
jgi:hypothetical protein